MVLFYFLFIHIVSLNALFEWTCNIMFYFRLLIKLQYFFQSDPLVSLSFIIDSNLVQFIDEKPHSHFPKYGKVRNQFQLLENVIV